MPAAEHDAATADDHAAARDGRTPLRPWPELMGVPDAAAFCGLTANTWRKLDRAGRCPPPVFLGRRLMWRRADLAAWVAGGCPPRDADAAAAYAAVARDQLDALPGRRRRRT